MRQSWIDYAMRVQRALSKRKAEGATLTMIIDQTDESVLVHTIGHQIEDVHLMAAAQYLISSLAQRHPDVDFLVELKGHTDRLLGRTTEIFRPSEVN